MRGTLHAALAALSLVVVAATGAWLTGSASATGVQTVPVCYDDGWDHSDSKPFNSEIVASQYTTDGLRIEVTGPTQKQSAYTTLAAPVAFQDVNQSDVQLTYQVDHGYAPAYQLTTFTDASATTWGGNLVYEDGRWWATRPYHWPLVPTAAQSLGGASLEAWKLAYPDAVIYRVGFSLGSGAAASAGTVRNLTFQGKMWVFQATCGPPVTTTSSSSSGSSTSPSSSSSSASASSSSESSTTTVPSTTDDTATTTDVPASTTVSTSQRAYYATCVDARRAGDAPLHWSRLEYRKALDADRDGVACEPNEGTDVVDLADTGSGGVARTATTIAGISLVLGLLFLLLAARRRRDDGRPTS